MYYCNDSNNDDDKLCVKASTWLKICMKVKWTLRNAHFYSVSWKTGFQESQGQASPPPPPLLGPPSPPALQYVLVNSQRLFHKASIEGAPDTPLWLHCFTTNWIFPNYSHFQSKMWRERETKHSQSLKYNILAKVRATHVFIVTSRVSTTLSLRW